MLRYVNLHNVCAILADATYLHCTALVDRLHKYMAVNAEALLESSMLDSLTPGLLREFSLFVQKEQRLKSPVLRSGRLVDEAIERNREWLELQDIPQTFVPTTNTRSSPMLSPGKGRRTSAQPSPITSPSLYPVSVPRGALSSPAGDDIFIMDDADPVPSLSLDTQPAVSTVGPWKPNPLASKYVLSCIRTVLDD